jgi:hypothetical protein
LGSPNKEALDYQIFQSTQQKYLGNIKFYANNNNKKGSNKGCHLDHSGHMLGKQQAPSCL